MLHYITAAPKVTTEKTVIVLHGYGANEYDLLPIAESIPDIKIISLRAPIELPWGGYAWYDLEQTPQGLRGDEVSRKANEVLLRISLTDILQKEQADLNNIFILGFSQGAAMSYALLTSDFSTDGINIKGVMALSGYLPNETKELLQEKNLGGLPIFISHGEFDELITPAALDEATSLLSTAGAEVVANKYPIGHGVNDAVIDDLVQWYTSHFLTI
jgi:phospholipase/carboxylesterase